VVSAELCVKRITLRHFELRGKAKSRRVIPLGAG
jgi:hypothetical protein